jgi:hypothetical protein
MSDTNATVVPLHTPAQRAAMSALVHYERTDGASLLPLSTDEKVVIAHLRGWAHFGPMCRLCMAGTR